MSFYAEKWREDTRETARSKMKKLLDDNKVFYFEENSELLAGNPITNIIDTPPIKFFISLGDLGPIRAKPAYIGTFVQEHRGPFNKDKNGYLKIPLRQFMFAISDHMATKLILAFYVSSEDTFYFKPGHHIVNYANAIIKNKNKKMSEKNNNSKGVGITDNKHMLPKEVFMKVNADFPREDLEEDKDIEADIGSNINSKYVDSTGLEKEFGREYRVMFPDSAVISTYKTVATQDDIRSYFSSINKYDKDFRLKFKTLSRYFK